MVMVVVYVQLYSTLIKAASNEQIKHPDRPVSRKTMDLSNMQQQDFLAIAGMTGTDKVQGVYNLPGCLNNNPEKCIYNMENPTCRVFGHFYHTVYNRWLGKYSTEDADPIQFLEIGYYHGKGFDAYTQFLPTAEKHSMEISCIEPGPRNQGKWPWGNFAEKNKHYKALRDQKRLHCGDAATYDFLHQIWTTEMKRPDAPPLMVVIDDGSHEYLHMATSLFFWLPRIEPGGVLIIEDVQATKVANKFRTRIMPQVMKDLHWCGDTKFKDARCFPTIQPFLEGVHCEMHICVFIRNDEPASEPDEASSKVPSDAFTNAEKCLFGDE